MYKKILALCLTVALIMTTAMTPVFADNFNVIFKGDDDENILTALFKPDKKQNDKLKDILKKFTDSDDVDWAEKSIEKMGAMGILNGIGNGLFKPNNNVTHAEAIAMVLKLRGEKDKAEAIKTQPEYFKDLSDIWSYGYLQLALDEEIIIPEEDGKFNPKTPAKRHEVAKYIVRALGKRDDALKNMDARLNFKDANSIPRTSVGYVYVINSLGIMQGSKNEFQPNKPITRAEMAVLLDRAEGKLDDTIPNSNALEGTFVSYDKNNSRITLEINDREVEYSVNPYAPVYRNSTYYLLDTLKPGDVIEIILNSDNVIIFIEFKEEGTAPSTGQQLSIQHIQYSSLSNELQDKIDTLKLTENYAAFKNDGYIYLIATRGRMRSTGYTIEIDKVYRETIQTGEYDLRAVVKTGNPSSTSAQSITYPYDVVKFAYFNGIEDVRFVDTENDLLKNITLNEIGDIEIIEGIIESVDTRNRVVYLKEDDDDVNSYHIPTSVQILLDNRSVALSALVEGMTLAITREDGIITKLVAESDSQNVEVIKGKVTEVNTLNRTIKILENDNVERSYSIPRTVQIIVNDRTASISNIETGMTIAITRTNGVITKLVAEDDENATETINGKIESVDLTNKVVYVKVTDNIIRSYYIPTTVQITLNNRRVTLSSLTANMSVVITRTNGVITKLAATQTSQTINGKIDSIDLANHTIKLLEANNVVNSYTIPENAQITLNNTAAEMDDLAKGMSATITKIDGTITKIAAQNDVQLIQGVLINVTPGQNSSTINVKVSNTYRQYLTTPETAVFYNNQSIAIQQMPLNTNITIKLINGIVTEVRNR